MEIINPEIPASNVNGIEMTEGTTIINCKLYINCAEDGLEVPEGTIFVNNRVS